MRGELLMSRRLLEETVRIQREGRERRKTAEKELLEIEGRLKTALMQTGTRLDAPRQN